MFSFRKKTNYKPIKPKDKVYFIISSSKDIESERLKNEELDYEILSESEEIDVSLNLKPNNI